MDSIFETCCRELVSGLRNDKSAYKYLPESVGQFPDGKELADRMTAAGLADVRFTPLTFGVATIYEGIKPNPANQGQVPS